MHPRNNASFQKLHGNQVGASGRYGGAVDAQHEGVVAGALGRGGALYVRY